MSDATPAKPKTGNILNREVGGVKVKWLLLVAVVTVVGVFLWRKFKGAGPVEPEVETPTYEMPIDDYNNSEGGVSDYVTGSSGQSYATSNIPTIDTNAKWSTNAANGLIGLGQYSGLDVSTTLANYLAGKPLTPQQNAMINQALASYGAPPEGVIPSSVATAPPSNAKRLYKVVKGDTLASIIQKAYGYITAENTAAFWAANPKVRGVNGKYYGAGGDLATRPFPGSTVYLPITQAA